MTHVALILATSKQEPRLVLRERRDRLVEQSVQTSMSDLQRFLQQHRITWMGGRRAQLDEHGFTLSLSIRLLTFAGNPELAAQTKIGILAGVLVCTTMGVSMLKFSLPGYHSTAAQTL